MRTADREVIQCVMLDRLYLHLRGADGGERLRFLFVLTDQPDPHVDDTWPLWERGLLERWCRARGVLVAEPVRVRGQVNHYDAAFQAVPAELAERLRHMDGPVTLALGPGLPQVTTAVLTGTFQGVRSAATFSAVQLLERRSRDRAVPSDTEVVSVRLPSLVGQRMLRVTVTEQVREWELENVGDLMGVSSESFEDRERSLAAALTAYLRRDPRPLRRRFGVAPPPTATGSALHLVDLIEYLWERGRTRDTGLEWALLLHLSLLVVEILPAAWVERYVQHHLPVHHTEPRSWGEALEAAKREWSGRVVENPYDFRTLPLEVHSGTDRCRRLLYAAGVACFRHAQSDDVDLFHRKPTRSDLPRDAAAQSLWATAYLAVRRRRNDLAHRFEEVDRDDLEALVDDGSATMREMHARMFAEWMTDRENGEVHALIDGRPLDPSGLGQSELRRFVERLVLPVALPDGQPNLVARSRADLLGPDDG